MIKELHRNPPLVNGAHLKNWTFQRIIDHLKSGWPSPSHTRVIHRDLNANIMIGSHGEVLLWIKVAVYWRQPKN